MEIELDYLLRPNCYYKIWFASNLATSLTHHISTAHPDLLAGGSPSPRHHVYPLLHSLQRLSLTRNNNRMWTTSSCPWSHIKTILQIRTHTLYTASSYTSRPPLPHYQRPALLRQLPHLSLLLPCTTPQGHHWPLAGSVECGLNHTVEMKAHNE